MIIQARMSSKRLPGKVLLPINEISVLERITEFYSGLSFVQNILIATSTDQSDLPIRVFAGQKQIHYFSGSLENVLERFWESATQQKLDLIIRHTADNIFVDKIYLEKAIHAAKLQVMGTPFIISSRNSKWPKGMEIEVFSFSALDLAYRGAKTQYALEHVTPFMYESDQIRKIPLNTEKSIPLEGDVPRCTLDTKKDVEIVSDYLNWLNSDEPSIENCIEWWKAKGSSI